MPRKTTPSARSDLRPSASQIDAVKHIVASLYAAQNALRALAPAYDWRGMGNVLGDYGEYIACEQYGFVRAPKTAAHDAVAKDGRTVQIKTNHAADQIGFRGNADMLLVLHVNSDGSWEEIYYGDFAVVRQLARYSARDNKWMVSIRKLRALSSGDEH